MEPSVLFSIIVPVYDLEKLVGRCLDSIRAQTFPNWECVVVDDGSTDSTGPFLDGYAQKNPGFTVIHRPNGGVSAARNTGMAAAKGQWLLFVDGDDFLEPFALEWIAEKLKQFPADGLAWRMRLETEPPFSQERAAVPQVYTARQSGAYLVGASGSNVTNRLFSARIIRENGLAFPEGVARGEDGQFCWQYIPAFFRARPESCIRQWDAPLYIIGTDNGSARASEKALAAHDIDWDPEQSRGYAARLMKEYESILQAMGGWDGFDEEDALYFAIQYCRRFAFAVWAAHKLGETLPEGFFGPMAVGGLTRAMKARRLYNAYYWPLRLRCRRLIRAVYESDEKETKRLYWRVFLIGDLALLRRWNKL